MKKQIHNENIPDCPWKSNLKRVFPVFFLHFNLIIQMNEYKNTRTPNKGHLLGRQKINEESGIIKWFTPYHLLLSTSISQRVIKAAANQNGNDGLVHPVRKPVWMTRSVPFSYSYPAPADKRRLRCNHKHTHTTTTTIQSWNKHKAPFKRPSKRHLVLSLVVADKLQPITARWAGEGQGNRSSNVVIIRTGQQKKKSFANVF